MAEVRRILLIQGHPDPVSQHLNRALLESYAEGAEAVGHAVGRIESGALDSRCFAAPMSVIRNRYRRP
jgi:putative NADPH-quinone reductase